MSHREKLIPGAVVKTAAFLRVAWRGARGNRETLFGFINGWKRVSESQTSSE